MSDVAGSLMRARLGDRDLDQQMIDQGSLAIAAGVCLALTGPTTPTFRLFTFLPGWPILWGALIGLAGVALLFCRWRGRELWLGQTALIVLGTVHGIGGATIFATWVIWKNGPQDTSEPLLTASVVLLYLGLRCGRVFTANAVRRRRGIGAACSA